MLENPRESGEQERTARELEAVMAAGRIKELMGSLQVTDKESGRLRPVRYGDIVILLRAVEGWAEVYQEVLNAEGIPCRSSLRSGYFSSYEVQAVLNMLRIIDNPLQDIPLTAVLRSPMGGNVGGGAGRRTRRLPEAPILPSLPGVCPEWLGGGGEGKACGLLPDAGRFPGEGDLHADPPAPVGDTG